ncbi:MAG: FAD-binding oxidoreductase [Leptospiraceae bacterium]|nr:FAD-binding oxidoreductase [Leptospiraceae bacterium]
MAESCQVLIVGGGILGASVAMHLAQLGVDDVVLCDLELSRGSFSSTNTNAGGVRATWWQAPNIRLSLESLEYFDRYSDEFDFRRVGYLWLYDSATQWEQARSHAPLQRKMGLDIQFLSPSEIAEGWPHLQTADLLGGTWSPEDGLISAYQVWRHYLARAREAGVRILDHHYVHAIDWKGSVGFTVRAIDFQDQPLEYNDDTFIKDVLMDHDWTRIKGRAVALHARKLVNAAGAWAPRISGLLGQERPLSARRRIITTFRSRNPPMERLQKNTESGQAYGMIVDVSGVYFHPEGPGMLAGYSAPEEPFGYHFAPADDNFFFEKIYAPLAKRFQDRADNPVQLRLETSWSGLYSYSLDISLVMGAVPGIERAFEIHSDTGKGVMHSYAAGRALATRIAKGAFDDPAHEDVFSWSRFAGPESGWLPESLHI